MDRYELTEGQSYKFWSVEVEGAKVTVHWGRKGEQGRVLEKALANPLAAIIERDKLAAEKINRGYALIKSQELSPCSAASRAGYAP